ncbi:hypothetical protein L2E82_41068 [Cichorium intybus]|uniref:Uncharacterized protein n=1 Tax=Cichorium intybus TaxID=13427 RepID=A0ACB9ALR1_CICIN|nr:hypothetical protein L2E82_41068 [Cichorium intybus]
MQKPPEAAVETTGTDAGGRRWSRVMLLVRLLDENPPKHHRRHQSLHHHHRRRTAALPSPPKKPPSSKKQMWLAAAAFGSIDCVLDIDCAAKGVLCVALEKLEFFMLERFIDVTGAFKSFIIVVKSGGGNDFNLVMAELGIRKPLQSLE